MNLQPIVVHMKVTERQENVRMGVKDTIKPQSIRDYEQLTNLPMINGKTLIGDSSTDDLGIVSPTFTYHQNVASNEWVIEHSLGKFPSVTVVDSGGNVVIGSVQYIDENTIICRFIGAFSGTAHLN